MNFCHSQSQQVLETQCHHFQEISSQPLRERQGQEDFFMLIEHHMYNKCSKHNAIILEITSPPLRERRGQEVFCHVDRVLETRRIHFKKLRARL